MSLRRAISSLLARRFSPRATPRTAPALSFHSLRNLPIGDGAAGVAGAAVVALAAGGALAVQYSNANGLLVLHDEEYENIVECVLAKGGSVMVIRDVKKGGTQAARDVKNGDTQAARDVKQGDTQVSA